MVSPERRILKNLVAVCVVFALSSLCFSSLQTLQSTLNSSKGLGLASLSCTYAVATASALFISPVLIRKVGPRKTVILGSMGYGIYAVSNFYPRFYTVIPAAILCGLAANPCWAAASTYLNILAANKAYLSSGVAEVLTNRYFAMMQMAWQLCYVFSTFLVSNVLTSRMYGEDEGLLERNFSLSGCGSRDCGAEIPEDAVGAVQPPLYIIQIFLGCYSACGLLLAPLTGILFMDEVKPKYSVVTAGEQVPRSTDWLDVFRALKAPHLLMLMPSASFVGVHFSFVMGDFTKSFVGCTHGIHVIGYVIMVFASTDTLFNVVLGWIREYVSRVVVTTFSGALVMTTLVVCLLWDPETGEVWHLYLLAAAFGINDAILQIQTKVFISVLFPSSQGPVFSAYFTFTAIGFAVSFGVSIPTSICVAYKIYGVISLLLVSLLLYYIVEIRFWMQGAAADGIRDDAVEDNVEKDESIKVQLKTDGGAVRSRTSSV
ncbi:protein unc-93 homolog A-like [Acanthaster planci]|uniref:Protein unc-93 homolog A-like n=1 Tax=Acanthaster planci TaxID=133434 RepID=A0A8B7XZX8_ACAPL|nr:protein unc-93 homolog A-like [Acanthaster planci]